MLGVIVCALKVSQGRRIEISSGGELSFTSGEEHPGEDGISVAILDGDLVRRGVSGKPITHSNLDDCAIYGESCAF